MVHVYDARINLCIKIYVLQSPRSKEWCTKNGYPYVEEDYSRLYLYVQPLYKVPTFSWLIEILSRLHEHAIFLFSEICED